MQSTLNTEFKAESPLSDNDLIESALRGDESGFVGLVDRYQPRLLGAVQNLVGCQAFAEDIVQVAFMKAFLHLASFRRDSGFYTWLYRIALNSRRGCRTTTDVAISLDSNIESLQLSFTDRLESPSAVAQRHEDRKQVREALSRISHHHRTILMLREFEGLDYQSIGEILHIGLGTVRSRLSRARAELRHELDKYQF